MKKEVIVLFLLGMLLISPLVLAQEQAQTYFRLNRFIDNVKMFFSSGDNKVMLALEIWEKEVNSAMINIRKGDGEEAEKNFERARKRLQFVQTKMSEDTANGVKINVDEAISKIGVEEKLPKIFETYFLEEEKTRLTAELIIEVEGKEGQTLTRKIVKDERSGKNKVELSVEGAAEEQSEVVDSVGEIVESIIKIDTQITEMTIDAGINEVVTDDDMIVDNGPVTGSDVGGGNVVDDGPCKGEENCNNDDGMAPQGIMGVFVPEPREDGSPSDSVDNSVEDSGEDSISITGEVIRNSNFNNLLKKMFEWLF